jgi:hypothetical protein
MHAKTRSVAELVEVNPLNKDAGGAFPPHRSVAREAEVGDFVGEHSVDREMRLHELLTPERIEKPFHGAGSSHFAAEIRTHAIGVGNDSHSTEI